jgi:Flp pilus assembly protein TadG
MQAFARILRSRISVSAFLADTRALAATEFAVIVPLMLVMFFGTVEFSSAVAIDRKVTLIARTLSDLTSQTPSPGTLSDASLQNAFTASISIMTPYDATLVRGTISQIFIDANKIATVQWSKAATIASGASQATLATSTRNAGDRVTSMIPAGLLNASSYLIFSEVDYTYTPTIGYVLKSSLPLHDTSYTRPRQVSCIMYGGAPSSCS